MSENERPWENEPDRWEAEYEDLMLLILRNPVMKNLCGYVGIPEGHSKYEEITNADYNDLDYDVHGGLTWSCKGSIVGKWPAGYYWIGFDCAHAWDFIPGTAALLQRGPHPDETYRDLKYVQEECIKLAMQVLGQQVPEVLQFDVVEEEDG